MLWKGREGRAIDEEGCSKTSGDFTFQDEGGDNSFLIIKSHPYIHLDRILPDSLLVLNPRTRLE